jgi:hypothetical protein
MAAVAARTALIGSQHPQVPRRFSVGARGAASWREPSSLLHQRHLTTVCSCRRAAGWGACARRRSVQVSGVWQATAKVQPPFGASRGSVLGGPAAAKTFSLGATDRHHKQNSFLSSRASSRPRSPCAPP